MSNQHTVHRVHAQYCKGCVNITGYTELRKFGTQIEAESYVKKLGGRFAIDGRLVIVHKGRLVWHKKLQGLLQEVKNVG